jgi:membrane protein YdbS with pleckstrin-like domain
MKDLGIKNFLFGIVILVITAIVAYVFFTFGLFVLSIAVAVTLAAALMVWVTSFFILRKQGRSVFTRYTVSKGGTDSTIIDVEFTEVKNKGSHKD